MNIIQSILFNEEYLELDGVKFTGHTRARYRKLPYGEFIYEAYFLQGVKNFDFSTSKAFQLLNVIFNSKFLIFQNLCILTRLFERYSHLICTREVYRRKKCMYYWFTQYYEEFKKLFAENKITFHLKDKKYYVCIPNGETLNVKFYNLEHDKIISITEKDINLITLEYRIRVNDNFSAEALQTDSSSSSSDTLSESSEIELSSDSSSSSSDTSSERSYSSE